MKDVLREQYAKFAPFYTQVGIKRGHFKAQVDFLNKVIAEISSCNVILDASCGTGNVLKQLSKDHPDREFYGLDGSAELLERAREHLNGSKAKIRLADWQGMVSVFSERTFDLIYMLGNSIAHCESEKELKNVISSVYSLLTQVPQ